MTITYDSNEAAAIGLAINMWADSATFQALCGTVGDSAATKAHIIESDGGIDYDSIEPPDVLEQVNCLGATVNLVPPYVLLHEENFQTEERGVGSVRRLFEIKGRLVMAQPSATPPEVMRYARNQAGLICDDIRARFRTSSSYLCSGRVWVAGHWLGDDTGAFARAVLADITISSYT